MAAESKKYGGRGDVNVTNMAVRVTQYGSQITIKGNKNMGAHIVY